jgi:TatA/E family protein of Tat protein translocase
MGFGNFGIWEMLVIGLFVLIFFGPQRMPEIARSLGKAMREFKKGVNEIQRELEVADRDTRQATRTTWQPPSSTTPKTAEEATGPVPEDLSIQPPPSPDYPAATAAVAGDAATEPVPVSTHRPPVTDVESESAIDGVYMGGPPGSDPRPEMETPPEMEDLPETEDPAGADPGTGALEESDEADDSQADLFRGNAPD